MSIHVRKRGPQNTTHRHPVYISFEIYSNITVIDQNPVGTCRFSSLCRLYIWRVISEFYRLDEVHCGVLFPLGASPGGEVGRQKLYLLATTCRNGSTINSLAPRRDFDFKCAIFRYAVVTIFMSVSNVIAFMWMAYDPTDDNSTVVEVMAWCFQATGRYMSQHWLRSMSLCVVTRPQGVKPLAGMTYACYSLYVRMSFNKLASL